MKYTLLEMVQSIASSMDSDEINSISDSVESLQIANAVRTAYFDLISRANLPEHYDLVQLNASGDNTKPVIMYLPDDVAELIWLRYDCMDDPSDPVTMRLLDYVPLNEFISRMDNLNPSNTDVSSFTHTIGTDTFTFFYVNDKQPSWYTTIDEHTVLFDSHDASIDTTLQKSKTKGWGKKVVPFTMVDAFTPDLDEDQFPLLLNEAKSLAWAELKQTSHGIAERNSRRGWTSMQNKRNAIQPLSDFDYLPNFGRSPGRGFGRFWGRLR